MITIVSDSNLIGGLREEFVRILVESFPPAERDEPEQVVTNISENLRQCYLALDDDALVGFAVLLPLDDVDVILLEYLAVSRDRRSSGIGGQVFEAVFEAMGHTAQPPRGLVLEAETPEGAEDAVLAQRRIAFYQRHGVVVVPGARGYRAPSTVGPELLSYTLMWRPMQAGEDLAGEFLSRCIRAILIQDYELADDDPLVAIILDGLKPS
ncbi:MAG: GNAT family N-acetyltransferase [Actinomycetota bacterium]|nr:GNAT family N-acetyltransferase [Actinomycetota bacterium]MDQ6944992.1 GNAT family N-acetyltransferase [Actinomycetota bacterium]